MLKDFTEQLRGISNELILRVMNRLDDDPETESLFLRWAQEFASFKPFDPDLWKQLSQHIKWPI